MDFVTLVVKEHHEDHEGRKNDELVVICSSFEAAPLSNVGKTLSRQRGWPLRQSLLLHLLDRLLHELLDERAQVARIPRLADRRPHQLVARHAVDRGFDDDEVSFCAAPGTYTAPHP